MLIKEGKTNIKYILIVVALAAIAAGFAITIIYTKEFPTPVIQQIVEKDEIDISNWQTYRNAQWGFQIDYPSYWEVIGSFRGGRMEYMHVFPRNTDDCAITSLWSDCRYRIRIVESLQSYHPDLILGDYDPLAKYGAKQIAHGRGDAKTPFLSIGIPSKNKSNTTIVFSFYPQYDLNEKEQTKDGMVIFEKILSTFRFVENEKVVLPTTCKDELEGVPVITSISPASGPIGTEVEMNGCNFTGFEGDLDAVFVRSDGAQIPLYGGTWYPGYGGAERGKLIKVTVQSYCESGSITGRYSGITSSCETVNATPGIYKVYVEAWGKKSNEVSFTIE